MRIAVDAMGGDHAPRRPVDGALAAARHLGIGIDLVGRADLIRDELVRHPDAAGLDVSIVDAPDLVTMEESAALALRRKPRSSVMVAAACFGLIAYLVGSATFSEYLFLNNVPGTGELSVVAGALIGAGLGFLWFNAPPAQIFMGDTGSLALGGALGTIAVATKHEIVLAIVGGLFVLETVSVIVQVLSFKLTGKRVFKMAPIHHHFEMLGWTESQVVIRFWIISFVLALIGLSELKLR